MSLPASVVERLFARLAATYGAAWDRSMGSAPLADVKTVWAHELAAFAQHLDSIAWALENLPERCPSVIEFKSLCRLSPAKAVSPPEVPKAPASPERRRAELAKLSGLRSAVAAQRVDGKAWAHLIFAKVQRGERVSPGVLRMARQALGVGDAR